jgi:hypothetical protein
MGLQRERAEGEVISSLTNIQESQQNRNNYGTIGVEVV